MTLAQAPRKNEISNFKPPPTPGLREPCRAPTPKKEAPAEPKRPTRRPPGVRHRPGLIRPNHADKQGHGSRKDEHIDNHPNNDAHCTHDRARDPLRDIVANPIVLFSRKSMRVHVGTRSLSALAAAPVLGLAVYPSHRALRCCHLCDEANSLT